MSGYLKSVSGVSLRLVRVYSEMVEYDDFAMPGHMAAYKARVRLADSVRDVSLQSISLHHLVRSGDSPAAVFIRSIDQRIQHHSRTDDQRFVLGSLISWHYKSLDLTDQSANSDCNHLVISV